MSTKTSLVVVLFGMMVGCGGTTDPIPDGGEVSDMSTAQMPDMSEATGCMVTCDPYNNTAHCTVTACACSDIHKPETCCCTAPT